jgi:hypothetical protein
MECDVITAMAKRSLNVAFGVLQARFLGVLIIWILDLPIRPAF